MKTKFKSLSRLGTAMLLLLLAAPVTHAFNYQGVLSQNGANAQGQFQMTFQLLEAGTPTTVGNPITRLVDVTNGLFQAELPFDVPFDGTPYDLQITVSTPGGPSFVLAPPTPLSATPQALFADSVGSVPDGALTTNVARLNQPADFLSTVSMPVLRLSDAAGGGNLRFGPTDDCSIGVDPVGPGSPAGLLLRDPRGIRILAASGPTASPPRLLFGPTDDCSLGIDPAMPGLIGRDPIGFRLLGQNNQGQRLIFGPTMDCTVEVDPGGPQGLLLRDPRGIRILPRTPAQGSPPAETRLIFGPTDDCSLGIDPTGANAGLIVEENFGVRITNPSGGASRVILGTGFGNNPDNLCMVAVDPAGPSGIQLRDPSGARLLSPPGGTPRLRFGPTDDCSIEVQPAGPAGLLLRDPRGIRILPSATAPGNPLAETRLVFGPTDDCSLGIDPTGVDTGLVVYENNGLRLANPNGGASRLMFGPGPDNLCMIMVDPSPNGLNGLQLRDPNGIRVLHPSGGASRLVFGNNPDNLCAIAVDPAGPAGLQLRDPNGIRILNPTAGLAPALIFGPTDDCSIRVAAGGAGGPGGMFFKDPNGFQFSTPSGAPATVDVQGVVRAQAFVQTSTRRLKENVQPLENALELIQQLQGVRYDWKAEMGGEADLGFIAEEVGKVIPEVVQWEEDGVNARGIDYARLVAVAMEGIKAQQAEIETLRDEKADMEARLARLEALVLSNPQAEK